MIGGIEIGYPQGRNADPGCGRSYVADLSMPDAADPCHHEVNGLRHPNRPGASQAENAPKAGSSWAA
ncbi:hypothetical protein GCM10027563_48430 [Parasphingorhabdus pacifica]